MVSSSAAVWLVLGVALLGANLPFLTERIAFIGPKRMPKSLGWRLLEMLFMWGCTVALGQFLEARLGQVHVQTWEFHAAFGFLFLTLAFPGFVWRYLIARPRPAKPRGAGSPSTQ